MNAVIAQVLQTTDVNAMAREIAEAYRLTVSLDRDMAAIDATLKVALKDADQLHEQIMFGLEKGFAEREQSIAIVKQFVELNVAAGNVEEAKQVLLHLMTVLEKSPTDRAIEQRATRYRPQSTSEA